MSALSTILLSLPLVVPPGPAAADAPASTAEKIRHAIQRSLRYLEAEGISWIKERKCVACHRVAFLTWSFSEAKKRGIAVDADKLNGWISWSLQKSLAKNKKNGKISGSTNIDGLSQLLLGRDSAAEKEHKKSYEKFVNLIVDGQQDNGSWKPGGQLPTQKRPKLETAQVSTMWNVLALMSAKGQSKETNTASEKALAWLRKSKPGKSNEWFVARLILEHRLGNQKSRAAYLNRLRSLQQPDGGWSWVLGEKSDAFATGQSLYALRAAGVPADDPAIAKARDFLLKTQRKDGSWHVLSTKASRRKRALNTSIYWGTAWAAIGLLQTLPDKPKRRIRTSKF